MQALPSRHTHFAPSSQGRPMSPHPLTQRASHPGGPTPTQMSPLSRMSGPSHSTRTGLHLHSLGLTAPPATSPFPPSQPHFLGSPPALLSPRLPSQAWRLQAVGGEGPNPGTQV